jgi:hypothetical protein
MTETKAKKKTKKTKTSKTKKKTKAKVPYTPKIHDGNKGGIAHFPHKKGRYDRILTKAGKELILSIAKKLKNPTLERMAKKLGPDMDRNRVARLIKAYGLGEKIRKITERKARARLRGE